MADSLERISGRVEEGTDVGSPRLKDIKKDNIQKHFKKLVELINIYNSNADNDYDKWSIKNIIKFSTIEKANNDPLIDW